MKWPLPLTYLLLSIFSSPAEEAAAWRTLETDYTISRVRSAKYEQETRIIASSYEGTLLSLSLNGQVHWTNPLSGYLIRDLWCADLDGDQKEEILAANADGSLYCLGDDGEVRWSFKPSIAPMNTVATIRHEEQILICCGGYDKNIYWLSTEGELLKTVPAEGYSVDRPWQNNSEKRTPSNGVHIANFIRPFRWDGKEMVLVKSANNSNNSSGTIYLFEPLSETPFLKNNKQIRMSRPTGDLITLDLNNDGKDEVIEGTSTMSHIGEILHLDFSEKKQKKQGWTFQEFYRQRHLGRAMDGLGYRIAQTVPLGQPPYENLLIAYGSRFIITPIDFDFDKTEVLASPYSFNDLWKIPQSELLLFASVQSGGSGIHLLDTSVAGWKESFANFKPKGKIAQILANTSKARRQAQDFVKPAHETAPKPVYLMTESLTPEHESHALALEKKYGSPQFLAGEYFSSVEDWDRETVTSDIYREKRDQRKRYTLTQEQMLERIANIYSDKRNGVAFWAGHGNDPYMLSTDTVKKIITRNKGEKTVLIYPELEQWNDEFAKVLTDHIYPIAETAQGNNTNIYIRTKHAFWHSIIYQPLWKRLLSGEFKDVFVPSMEETTDKTPEQTTPARLGIWVSGAVDQWGSRAVRDNPSFDRLRQHSHQMLPNHFLRNQIYHLALGSTYQNNFAVDQEYFSFLYELIAKGVLYVPDRNEIVSFNPVFLGMKSPDPQFLDAGNNVKWLTFFDAKEEKKNPMVFGRLDGSWPGSPVQAWDYSSFAAGVKDRRLNYLPPHQNGLVLIAPAQEGVFADPSAPRGKMVDNLHPLYREHMQEFITDGRQYLSADGTKTYPADEHYQQVKKAIVAGAKQLPLTVTGEVTWVVAQTAPDRLRLTLIDGGYLNPNEREATITFHAVAAKEMTELLTQKVHTLTGKQTSKVKVPCGLFRFYDIQLTEPFYPKK